VLALIVLPIAQRAMNCAGHASLGGDFVWNGTFQCGLDFGSSIPSNRPRRGADKVVARSQAEFSASIMRFRKPVAYLPGGQFALGMLICFGHIVRPPNLGCGENVQQC
jgi:hypothetical protein